MLLICGGANDPNIITLEQRLAERNLPGRMVTHSHGQNPPFSWNMTNNQIEVNGTAINPQGAFIRYDVFNQDQEEENLSAFKALAWHSAVMGWALAQPDVRLFNRHARFSTSNKLFVLCQARMQGLDIPGSIVSNEMERIARVGTRWPLVAKPSGGGGYCMAIDVLLRGGPDRASPVSSVALGPAIVQEELVPPEIRVYLVGPQVFAFLVEADTLDYRLSDRCAVTEIPVTALPDGLVERLRSLAGALGLDFAAADFKTCPRTGALMFLEINNQPMFAAFDQACGGSLTDAIIDSLTESSG